MINDLLNVIRKVFIQNDSKVILATHSPTTVALSEENIFEIKKGNNRDKIKKISKQDAVEILSEGFMTMEKGVKIFDAIFKKEITIISEGKNQRHIKKSISILDSSLLEKIQFYEHDA